MPLSAPERENTLARRPWTKSERRIVLHGFFGRLLIAIEPLICFAVFGALTAGLIFFPLSPEARMTRWESAIVIAPIFGLASLAFLIYTVALLVTPLQALLQTYAPIYVVDGYVRYRRPDRDTQADSNGYVAVLDDERVTIAEWVSIGDVPLPESVRPAMIEFSQYGGIHRIDGKSTGVLPDVYPALGVGRSTAPRA
jgi:hypothetical protein